jgi:hypothetical protein
MHKIGKNWQKLLIFLKISHFFTLFALKLSLMSSRPLYECSDDLYNLNTVDFRLLAKISNCWSCLKISSHFETPATLAATAAGAASSVTGQVTCVRTRSLMNRRMELTRDGAVGQICTLHLLKFNLLLILYLKVWNKIVHKSWKSKKLETHNHNVLRFKAFIINKTFSMFGTCKFCILEDLTKNIILTAGYSWPAPLPYGLVFLWGHYMTLAPLRGILTDLRKNEVS